MCAHDLLGYRVRRFACAEPEFASEGDSLDPIHTVERGDDEESVQSPGRCSVRGGGVISIGDFRMGLGQGQAKSPKALGFIPRSCNNFR